MSTLTMASRQWSTRPADQRFSSLEALHERCTKAHESAVAANVSLSNIRLEARDGDLVMLGRKEVPAQLTHWAFGQLCSEVGAPAGYIRNLPATLAAQNINHGLAVAQADEPKNLYFHRENDSMELQAMLSQRYCRIWNDDVTARLLRLTRENPEWQPAPAAFDGSRGLYASDSDMFAFLVDNNRRIFEKDPNGGLSRGFFVWNSEVGKASFGVLTFLYEYVCGNHLVWGATGVAEIRIRHVGNADARVFSALAVELRKYANSSAADDELKIERARNFQLGKSKDEVLDFIFGKRIPGLSRNVTEQGYDKAVSSAHAGAYGNPRSVWGLVNGLTEIARDLPHADARVSLERAAGKVMEIAF